MPNFLSISNLNARILVYTTKICATFSKQLTLERSMCSPLIKRELFLHLYHRMLNSIAQILKKKKLEL